MEKLEALEQLQSHIEGWEVCLGWEGLSGLARDPAGCAAAGTDGGLGTRCSLQCILFGLHGVYIKKIVLIISRLSPHKNLDFEFLLKNQ